MSEEWRRGDLALCVDNEPRRFEPMASKLEVGRIYMVAAVGLPVGGSGVFCLAFRDVKTDPGHGAAFDTRRFRKIKPDEPERCEEEFLTLLRRSKQTVPA